MGLVPISGVLETISKLERESPDAARALVIHGLYDSLCEQVDALRPVLEPAILRQMGEVAKEARAALTRASVAKAFSTGELHGEREAAALDAVEDYVAKGLIGSLLQRFNEQHPRDERGRFIRADVKGKGVNRATVVNSSHKRAARKVQEMHRVGLLAKDTPITVHVRSTDAGGQGFADEMEIESSPASMAADLKSLPGDHQVTGVSVKRKHLPKKSAKQQAGLDIVGMLADQDEIGSQRLLNRVERMDLGGADTMNSEWNAPSQGGANMDRQAYRRMKMTGQVLSGLSAPGSTMSVAGGVAQLVGEIGPEAEKVLAPGIRRAAYRYRGTERRPDADLRKQVKEAQGFAAGKGDWSQDKRSNPAAAIGVFHSGSKLSRDQADLLTGGDAVVGWMLGLTGGKSQLVDRKAAELSMASGEVPPSRGVILDADGDLVSQAVGFNGDHYLPFDLRNLGRLYGGQYVRTRATGGPTGEDLYTSLMTGARQFQVVSNSGVFTVELDPDLRGGRRYSDKARRMVSRYQEMLEAIADKDSNLYERDLTNEQKREIRRQAAANASTPEEFAEDVKRLENRARTMGALAAEEGEDDEAMEAATSMARTRLRQELGSTPRSSMPSKQAQLQLLADFRDEAYAELTGGQVKRMSLNGAGYERALKALQQEFPYFIRSAEWRPLPEWLAERELRNPGFKHDRANDRGHVTPGQTNPALGLKGANARRRVPDRLGAKVVRDEKTVEGGGGPAPAAPAAAAVAPVSSPKKVDVSPAALIRPGTKVHYALTEPSAKLLELALDMPPQNPYQGDPAKLSGVNDPHAYINALAGQIIYDGVRNQSGRRFVDWFFTKASPMEREKVMHSLESLETISTEFATKYEPAEIRSMFDAFAEAADLVEPYATVGKDDNAVVTFDAGDRPKPAPPRMLGLDIDTGSPPEEIARVKARLASTDPAIGKLLEAMKTDGDADRQASLESVATRFENTGEDKYLKRAAQIHTAWSVLHTEEVAAKLRKMVDSGDAGPFVKAAPRRRVIVHKADDPFSRRTLAALGIR